MAFRFCNSVSLAFKSFGSHSGKVQSPPQTPSGSLFPVEIFWNSKSKSSTSVSQMILFWLLTDIFPQYLGRVLYSRFERAIKAIWLSASTN